MHRRLVQLVSITMLVGGLLSFGGQVFGQTALEPELAGFQGRSFDKSAVAAFEQPTSIPTETWAVRLRPGMNPDALAGRLGYINEGQIATLPNTYLFVIPNTGVRIADLEGQTVASLLARSSELMDGRAVESASSSLRTAPEVVWYEQQLARQNVTRAPSDPLYPQQWHLNNNGQNGIAGNDVNILPVWDMGYDGTGVTISVVDEGMQFAHPDLSPNFLASASWDWIQNDSNPSPNFSDEGHGTAVGGVAAGSDDGTSCGVGAAYNARLSSQRLIGGLTTDAMEANALGNRPNVNDIFNNSWGPLDFGGFLFGPGPLLTGVMNTNVQEGRNGYGNIYLWAAGNGEVFFDYGGADGYSNSRYAISVGATDPYGEIAYYSEPGSAVLVNAPSGGGNEDDDDGTGIRTTDLLGSSGYNTSGDCTDEFNGTSSSTPLVSGVIALMLDANPTLTWRDVQHILVNTSDRTDPGFAGSLGWRLNGAGRFFSEYYGFGRVDAQEAVDWALGWGTVPPEQSASSPVRGVNQALVDGEPTSYRTDTYTMSTNIHYTEHVEVVFNATHTYRGDVRVLLRSPSGTFSVLMLERPDPNDNFVNWTFSSSHFWGEDPNGTWTIYVSDVFDGDLGVFQNWQLRVYGTNVDPINRVANSAFNQPIGNGGNRNWGPFSSPGALAEDMTYFWTGNAIDFHRKPRAAPFDANNAGILQYTHRAVANGAVMEVKFDAANTGLNRRRLTVIAWDEDFGDLRVCTFWMPGWSGLHTYTMRFRTSRSWTGAMLHFYGATADTQGYYRIDNVSLRQDRSTTSDATLCHDPLLPTAGTGTDSANFVGNGDFGTGINTGSNNWGLFPDDVEWQIIGNVFNYRRAPALSSAVVLQNTTNAIPSGRRFEATFQLANTTGSTQRVTILIHAGDFSDLTACSFYVSNSPTLQTYTMRGFATQPWSSASISFYLATTATSGYVQLDNVTLRTRPSLAMVGTECYPSGSAPADVLFDADRALVPTIEPTATTMPYTVPGAPNEIPVIIVPAPTLEPVSPDEGTVGE